MRSFKVVCPFCENTHPLPDDFEEIYGCGCGALYKIAWRSEMEGALDELIRYFLKKGDSVECHSRDDMLCQAVIYEDIQNMIRMKVEYESLKYFRCIQSFDSDYNRKIGLIWLGNPKGKDVCATCFPQLTPISKA